MHSRKKSVRLDLVLAAIMVAMGLTVAGLSWSQLSARKQMAQATVPNSETPQVPAGKVDGPSEPGGARPTTPPPEPARPDADAQKAGAKPALPPAPAEKMGEPVKK